MTDHNGEFPRGYEYGKTNPTRELTGPYPRTDAQYSEEFKSVLVCFCGVNRTCAHSLTTEQATHLVEQIQDAIREAETIDPEDIAASILSRFREAEGA